MAPVSFTSGASLSVSRAASATRMPSLAKSRASEAERPLPAPTMSAVSATSVRLRAGSLDHRRPFRGLGAHVVGELLGRAPDRIDALVAELVAHPGALEYAHHLGVHPRHHLARQVRRPEQREP